MIVMAQHRCPYCQATWRQPVNLKDVDQDKANEMVVERVCGPARTGESGR